MDLIVRSHHGPVSATTVSKDTLVFFHRELPSSAYCALVNTFFSTPKNCVSHTFNGQGKKRIIDYILTRQRDRKLVRDVVVYPQALLKPISDHNLVAARVKLLSRFARNRPVRNVKKPPIDRRRLTTDPYLPRGRGENERGPFKGDSPKR